MNTPVEFLARCPLASQRSDQTRPPALTGPAHLQDFDRVFDLFDGNDETAMQAARERWKTAKAAGHKLAYWQQGARGWEKKA